MKKLIILLLLLSSSAFAGDYYVAQSAAGSGHGSSCGNAKAISWNWASPNVVAGDTVHVCGTITSTLSIPTSGTAESPITIKFESGAKFSKAYWGTTTSAAIVSSGKNYIVIDGGINGIIENTANGTALANQQNSCGIYLNGGTNLEVKNLTIQNMYVRTADSVDRNATTGDRVRGIYAHSTSGILIHNNTITHCKYGIISVAESNAIDAAKVYSNTIQYCSTGVAIAASASGYNVTNLEIYDNIISDGYTWNSGTQIHHNDGVHLWVYGTGKILTCKVYRNTFSGNWGGDTTAMVFLEGNVSSAVVHNNVFNVSTVMPVEGYIDCGTSISGTLRVYNNTLKGITGENTGKFGVYAQTTNWATLDIRNNIFHTFYAALNVRDGAVCTADYNDYYGNGNIAVRMDGMDQIASHGTLASWQTYLGGCPGSDGSDNECSSITLNPLFVSSSDLTLQSGSPAKDTGKDLGSSYNTDRAGSTRRGSWDMGAYEYGSGSGD